MIPFASALVAGPVLFAGFGNGSLSTFINLVLVLLIAIDVHELGHAIVADRLGDDTPRVSGHMSLNPFRHMDQFGILLLFITAISAAFGSGQGFTYGFTPVNEQRLRQRTPFGPAIVALAGPLMNLLLAAVLAVPLTHNVGIALNADGSGAYTIAGNTELFQFVSMLFQINVFLCVFNLVPLPLDGWTIFSAFLSTKARFELRNFVQYGPFILLLLIFFEPQIHFFSAVIYPITDWVQTQLFRL
jgi:Zn-dependent protease